MNKNKILGYVLGPVGSAILGFISLPIITWFYSIEDVGKISMLQVVASLTVLLFCLGLDQAYIREYHEVEDKPKLFKLAFLPGFLLLILVFTALYLFDEMLISRLLYGEESQYLTIISFLCFTFAFGSRFLSLILRMQERSYAYSMSQILPKLFFLLFILSTVWLGFTEDFFNLITAHALSILVVFLVFSWNTRYEWLQSISKPFVLIELKQLLSFGLPLVIGGLAMWGLNVIGKVFLRSFSTFSELGVYSVTLSIASVATIFASVFNIIWAPLVYKWVNQNKVDFKKIDEISECLRAVVYFIVVFSGLLSWILPFLLPPEYSSIQYIISACLLGPLFYTLSEVSAVGISIAKKTKYSMYASIFAMSVNAFGSYILIPSLGAAGAAISAAISFYLFYIFRTEFSKRVWRNFGTCRIYLEAMLLLSASIFTALYNYTSISSFYVWLTLLLFGFYIYRNTIVLFSKLLRQHFV